MLNFVPFLGSYAKLLKFWKEHKPVMYPIVAYIRHVFGENPPTFVGFVFGRRLCLFINRHEPL